MRTGSDALLMFATAVFECLLGQEMNKETVAYHLTRARERQMNRDAEP